MDAEVIVVGGGPVGLGLAIELGRRGVRVLLIEKYPEPQPIPKGQNLTQRTMEHMAAWGCEAALRSARTIPADYGIGGLTAYGTLTGPYAYDWLPREAVRAFYSADNERLPQYATERVLRARVAALPSVTCLFGWEVDGVAQDGGGVIVGARRRGRGDERREWRAAYAAGCDGSRSIVREAAGIGQGTADHDRLMVLLVFRSAQLNALLARYPGKSFYNVLDPALQGYWKFFGRVDLDGTFFFHAPVPRGARDGGFDFRAYLEGAVGESIDVAMDHVGFWDLRFAVADRYRSGRLFVAGDAAHSHPPYGGYGINTGLEDARNLGWKLAARLRGWGGEPLLDSYDAERRPVFESTARDFIARAIEADRSFLAEYDPARDRPAFESAWQARATGAVAEVGSFEPHYEGSPVVDAPGTPSAVGEHRAAARPGHHLSPFLLEDGRSVWDALGSGFTLLDARAGNDGSDFAGAAARLGIPLTVIATRAVTAEQQSANTVVLVRPDHFVAFAGEVTADPDALLCRASGGGTEMTP